MVCCSCCGYLCTFQVSEGKSIDPATRKSTSEKGVVTQIVKDLVGPFSGFNHIVYMENYFTSGPPPPPPPLVEELAQTKFMSLEQRAVGFPEGLKSVKLSKGNYASERVADICYYVFEDRSSACFVSNVFPEAMETQVVRVQLDKTLQFQSIPPLLPAYNK